MKTLAILLTTILTAKAFAVDPLTVYFSCDVKETIEKKTVDVNVKFKVENLDIYSKAGTLAQYPGLEKNAETEYISILVTPSETENGFYTRMSNLNAQGGDFSILEDGSIMLWGDGDGYQFTDLVIWDVDTALANGEANQDTFAVEGYVRDYGPAYAGEVDFKQFIKCVMSTKEL